MYFGSALEFRKITVRRCRFIRSASPDSIELDYGKKMNEVESSRSLSRIRRSVPSGSGDLTVHQALLLLAELVDRQIPAAMHQMGQWLWEGIAVEPDVKEAFHLISSAVAMGHSQAMESLGAMYLVGAGCDRNFNTARYWYAQRELTNQEASDQSLVHIGGVGLKHMEFRPDFEFKINGTIFKATDIVLEKLNLGLIQLKASLVEKQLSMIQKDPQKWQSVMRIERLPWRCFIGSPEIILAGKNLIEEVGTSDGWGNVSWLPLADFSNISERPSLSEFDSLSVGREGHEWKLDTNVCRAIRVAYNTQNDANPSDHLMQVNTCSVLPTASAVMTAPIELHVGYGRSRLVFRGGQEIYSSYI